VSIQLIFVRHGESVANTLREFSNRGWQHPLTETGRQQAEILALRLARCGVTRIYTSPLMRTVQTAEILSAALGVPFEIDEALREYDVGESEGSSDPTAWGLYHEVDRAWQRGEWDRRMPGGESFNEIRARFIPFIDGLLAQFSSSDEVIVLVGHGGLYRTMLPQVLVNITPQFAREFPLPYSGQVVAEPSAEGWVCVSWWESDAPRAPFSAA
jgi:broad specificity phosphatase PhoE